MGRYLIDTINLFVNSASEETESTSLGLIAKMAQQILGHHSAANRVEMMVVVVPQALIGTERTTDPVRA